MAQEGNRTENALKEQASFAKNEACSVYEKNIF
jgi:hypothetical protein